LKLRFSIFSILCVFSYVIKISKQQQQNQHKIKLSFDNKVLSFSFSRDIGKKREQSRGEVKEGKKFK
jgi:hypothetical protein